jgi:large repetitive protein
MSVATSGTDLNATNSSGSPTVTVGAGSADLSTTISTPSIAPGGTGNATVTVSNAGPSSAAGPVTVTYNPPAGADIASLPTGCAGPIPGGPISCAVAGPVPVGGSVTLDIPLKLSASATPGATLSGGSVDASSPTADATPANNGATSEASVAPAAADVSVAVTTPSITPGTTGNVSLTASNAGPSDAAGPVVFTYSPPAGASIVSLPSGCSGTIPAGPISCTQPGPIAAGATTAAILIPISIPASATPGVALTGGTAGVSTATADPTPANNSTSSSIAVAPGSADLTTSSSTSPIVPGGTGTATLTVANAGPSNAAGPISVTYTPPTGVEITALPAGCTGPIPAGPIVCSVAGPIAPGASVAVDVPLKVLASATPSSTLGTGGALSASSPTADPTPGNNGSTPTVPTLAASADLSVSSVTPAITPGSTGNATVTVANAGPSNAAGPITVGYTPPSGASITSLPAGCTGPLPNGPINCTVAGPLAPGATVALQIPLMVDASAAPLTTLVGGTTSVSSPTADPNSTNDSAPASVPVGAGSADVAASATIPTLVPGTSGNATLTASNIGPSNAAGPIAIDFTPPAGYEITTLPTGCTGTIPAGPISCSIPGPIPPGGHLDVTVPIALPSGAAPSSTLGGGSVTATSATADPAAANNTAPVSGSTALGSTDLFTTVAVAPAAPGTSTTATLTATNNGPSSAAGPVTITFTPPANTEIASMPAGCTGPIPAGPITCTVAASSLANGASASVDVPLNVLASAPASATLTGGSATSASATADPTPANNTVVVSVATLAGSADLSTAVTTPTIVPGTNGNATIAVSNAGPSEAAGPITVGYTPPVGAEIASLPAGCTGPIPAGPISCTVTGPIAPGASVSVIVPLHVPASTPAGPLSGGSAGATSPTADPTPANNTVPSTLVAGTPSADVVVSASTPAVAPGKTGTQQLIATNNGPSDAQGPITFTYTPPTGVKIVSLPAGCTGPIPNGPVTCVVAGPIPTGSSVSVDIPIKVPSSMAPNSTIGGGTVGVTTGTADPATTNNTAPVSLHTNPAAADLTSMVSTPTLTPGTNGVATVTVTNNGPADAAGPITVSYTPPTGVEIVSLPAGCTGPIPNGPLACTVAGPIADGASVSLDIPVRLPSGAAPVTAFTGGGSSVTSATPDPTPTNNAGPSTVNSGPGSADLVLAATSPALTPGTTGNATLTATNNGPSTAGGPVTFVYSPPSGVEIVSLPAGCTGSIPSGPITCVVAGDVLNGGVVALDVPIRVRADAPASATLTGGTASVSAVTTDPLTANNSAPATVATKAGSADLVSAITIPVLTPGQSGLGIATFTNNGPSDAAGPLTVHFTPPVGMEITSLPTGCTGTLPSGPLTCTVAGPLAPGASTTLDIPLHLPANAVPGAVWAGGSLDVGSPTADPTPANNTVPVSATVGAGLADLSASIATPAMTPGTTGTATITVTNAGPSDAAGPMTVTFTPPVGVQIVALPAGCTGTVPNGPLTCTVAGPIAPGASVTIPVELALPANASPTAAATGGAVGVTGPTADPSAANNTVAFGVSPTAGSADLKIVAAIPATVPGETTVATITVSNNGPSDAAGPQTVTFTPPAGFDIVALPAGCTGTLPNGPLSCVISLTIDNGASTTLAIPLKLRSDATPSATLAGGSVSVSSPTGDPSLVNNTAALSGTSKAALSDLTLNVATPGLAPGTTGIATVNVNNVGPSDSKGPITVQYTPPVGITITALPNGCTGDLPNGPITCVVTGPIATDGSIVIDIPIKMAADAVPGVALPAGKATVTGPNADPTPANNDVAVKATPADRKFDILLSSTTPEIAAGETGIATVQILNGGPSDAPGPFTVTYKALAGLVIDSFPANCSVSGSTVTCTIAGPLGSTTSQQVAIKVSRPAVVVASSPVLAYPQIVDAPVVTVSAPVALPTAQSPAPVEQSCPIATGGFRFFSVVACPNRAAVASAANTEVSTPVDNAVSVRVAVSKDASVVITAKPANGQAKLVNGEVVYSPNPAFVGTDEIEVTVTEADGTVTVRKIKVQVKGIQASPLLSDDDAPRDLAFTGSASLDLALAGGALVLAGSALNSVRRRRKENS